MKRFYLAEAMRAIVVALGGILTFAFLPSGALRAQGDPELQGCGGFNFTTGGRTNRIVTNVTRTYNLDPRGGFYNADLQVPNQVERNSESFVIEGDLILGTFDYNRSTTRRPYTLTTGVSLDRTDAQNPVRINFCDTVEMHIEVPTWVDGEYPIDNMPNIVVHLTSDASTSINLQGNVGFSLNSQRYGSLQIFPWAFQLQMAQTPVGTAVTSDAVIMRVKPYYEQLLVKYNDGTLTPLEQESFTRFRNIMRGPGNRDPGRPGKDEIKVTFVDYLNAFKPLVGDGVNATLLGLTEAYLAVDNPYRTTDPGNLPAEAYREFAPILAGAAKLYNACKNYNAAANATPAVLFTDALRQMWSGVTRVSDAEIPGSLGYELYNMARLPPAQLCKAGFTSNWIMMPGPYVISLAFARHRIASNALRYFYWLAFEMHFRGLRPDGSYGTTSPTNPREPLLCMTCRNRSPLNRAIMAAINWPQTVPELINGTGFRPMGTHNYMFGNTYPYINNSIGQNFPRMFGQLGLDFTLMNRKVDFRAYEILYDGCYYRAGTQRLPLSSIVTRGSMVYFCREIDQTPNNSTARAWLNGLNWRTMSYNELMQGLATPATRAILEQRWGAPFVAGDCFLAGDHLRSGYPQGFDQSSFSKVCIDAQLRPQGYTITGASQDQFIPLCAFTWRGRPEISDPDPFTAHPQGDFDELLDWQ